MARRLGRREVTSPARPPAAHPVGRTRVAKKKILASWLHRCAESRLLTASPECADRVAALWPAPDPSVCPVCFPQSARRHVESRLKMTSDVYSWPKSPRDGWKEPDLLNLILGWKYGIVPEIRPWPGNSTRLLFWLQVDVVISSFGNPVVLGNHCTAPGQRRVHCVRPRPRFQCG